MNVERAYTRNIVIAIVLILFVVVVVALILYATLVWGPVNDVPLSTPTESVVVTSPPLRSPGAQARTFTQAVLGIQHPDGYRFLTLAGADGALFVGDTPRPYNYDGERLYDGVIPTPYTFEYTDASRGQVVTATGERVAVHVLRSR